MSALPGALTAIVRGAFSPEGISGGVLGAMVVGFQRAAFSNKAGLGSTAIAHSAVRSHHPATERLVALLEPFIDTVVNCTITALVILTTIYESGLHGIGRDDRNWGFRGFNQLQINRPCGDDSITYQYIRRYLVTSR